MWKQIMITVFKNGWKILNHSRDKENKMYKIFCNYCSILNQVLPILWYSLKPSKIERLWIEKKIQTISFKLAKSTNLMQQFNYFWFSKISMPEQDE